jgi:hypothetical protein
MLAIFVGLLTFAALGEAPDSVSADHQAVRTAIERSLPLLQAGAKSFRERSEGRCISCHHQGLVLPSVALARSRGFNVDEVLAREEIERVHGFYARRQARYEAALKDSAAAAEVDRFGNFTVHAGYWLWALAAEKVPPDEALATAVRQLSGKQWVFGNQSPGEGHWSFTDVARAPMQASDFTTTALAVFAIKQYGTSLEADSTANQLAAAKAWLLSTTPRTTDDKVFRLFGLKWTYAAEVERSAAAQALLADQRPDGGWAQQANMPTDAYATGLALVALAQADDLPTTDAAYVRGMNFLLKTQHVDGSWFVKTRAIPTNPYFESGFPHGKSQFISYAATCWATMALTLALPLQSN